MTFASLFSPCFLFGHEEPIKALKGKQLLWVCPRCVRTLGVILPNQRLKVKKEQGRLKVVSSALRSRRA